MKNKNTMMTAAILAAWFFVMYMANLMMPLYRDDYLAAMVWRTGEHLSNMSDVFESLDRYYLTHGGRLVSFFIQFVFMLYGKFWFNIANAIMFVAMLVVMLMHCRRDFKFTSEPLTLILIGAFCWLGISHFGEIAIWLCGSAVYLWTGLFAGLFLLPYNLHLAGKFNSNSILFAILMFPAGMIAACSVENLTITTTVIAIGTCIYTYKQQGKFSTWLGTGALGSLIGTIICIAAPGNYVRIEEDRDRSWLFHFLNQIPSNLDMIMYMLPIILTLIIAARLLILESARRHHLQIPEIVQNESRHYVLLAILGLSTVSFFTTGFFAKGLEWLVVKLVLTPIGLTDEVTISHFENTMAGFEEALIYILSVIYVYLTTVKDLGISKERLRDLKSKIDWRQLINDFTQLRYGLAFIALAFFNNFLMVGAPSFPGRALFSSSIMFIIGAVVILRIPEVKTKIFESAAGKIFRRGGAFITGFIIIATLIVLHSIYVEDAIRVNYIAREAHAGVKEITLPPSEIPEQRRILRHIAYDDFDNGMTREHICIYFGIDNIKLDPRMSLKDIH